MPRLLTFLADSGTGIQLGRPRLMVRTCGRFALGGFHQRKCFRTTSFRPDHMSETAHTFTSTRSVLRARERMRFSSRSVATFADFLGQETQIAPVLRIDALAV